MNTFYIYSKTGCGYCNRLIQFMEQKDIEHEVLELNKDYTAAEFYGKFGQGSTFPQVNFKNQNLGGMRDTVQYVVEHKLY